MKPRPRQMEERLAWRSLTTVALPALLLVPLLAVQRGENCAPAGAPAPLFTLAPEPPPRAKAEPLLPAAPETAVPAPQMEHMVQSPVPAWQEVNFTIGGIESPMLRDSELTVANLPEMRHARRAPRENPPVTDSQSPEYLSNPKPPYPAGMRQRRIQGSVGVRIAVSPQGLPTAVDITQPSGHAEFDFTTRNWILRHWRFRPAKRGGAAVASSITTTVRFRLH